MMSLIAQFYTLSKLLDDDLYKVAFVVYSCCDDRASRVFYYILRDLESHKLNRYRQVFQLLLDEDPMKLKEIANGMTFRDHKAYIKYLQNILTDSDIPFSPFIKAIDTPSRIYNSIAFVYEGEPNES